MNNNGNEENKSLYSDWESSSTESSKKETLEVPKENFSNYQNIDENTEGKPYTIVKLKDRKKVIILNKLITFITFVAFAMIGLYLFYLYKSSK